MSPRPPWQPGKAWLYTWLYSHWQLGPSSGQARAKLEPSLGPARDGLLNSVYPQVRRRPWVNFAYAPITGGRALALPVTASARSPQLGSSSIWNPWRCQPCAQSAGGAGAPSQDSDCEQDRYGLTGPIWPKARQWPTILLSRTPSLNGASSVPQWTPSARFFSKLKHRVSCCHCQLQWHLLKFSAPAGVSPTTAIISSGR